MPLAHDDIRFVSDCSTPAFTICISRLPSRRLIIASPRVWCFLRVHMAAIHGFKPPGGLFNVSTTPHWRSRPDLNRRPLPYQGSALPTEPRDHNVCQNTEIQHTIPLERCFPLSVSYLGLDKRLWAFSQIVLFHYLRNWRRERDLNPRTYDRLFAFQANPFSLLGISPYNSVAQTPDSPTGTNLSPKPSYQDFFRQLTHAGIYFIYRSFDTTTLYVWRRREGLNLRVSKPTQQFSKLPPSPLGYSSIDKNGADGGTRTPNPLICSSILYLLLYNFLNLLC